MARDYKFAMDCYQDQYGSEDAKANIFVNGTQVVTELAITATSSALPQTVTFEAELADPADGVNADIKVVLTNEAYVDASNDRNIWITSFNFADKATSESDYQTRNNGELVNITDWTDHDVFWNTAGIYPSNVQGSQIESTWWADGAVTDGTFYNIPVWGDSSDTGTTITMPLTKSNTDPIV